MTLSELIIAGEEKLESDRLEDAEQDFGNALQACQRDEDRQEVLRYLLRLAGKYLRLGQSNKPQTLYDYLAATDLSERSRVLEWLARLHLQLEDLAGAEQIYLDIFEERLRQLGPGHPDTVGTLQTAALMLQMQGTSAEGLFARAYEISRNAKASEPVAPELRGLQRLDEAFPAPVDLTAPIQPHKSDPQKPQGALFMLDALLVQDTPVSQDLTDDREVPEFPGPLTISEDLQDLIAAWEMFSSRITLRLAHLLQQSSHPEYRDVLSELLSSLMGVSDGLKPIDLDRPFLGSGRSSESNQLDWKILKELSDLYTLFDGSSETCPLEAATTYACLRRAHELGPLHIDTLQNLYRLSYMYARHDFGCYDLESACAGFSICLSAYKEHPRISDPMRITCYCDHCAALAASNELQKAGENLAEAMRLADSCKQMTSEEFISVMKALGAASFVLGNYQEAASAYERLRTVQEATSRNAELFETLVLLICIYRKSGKEDQIQPIQQRLIWEVDWLEKANPVRETIARKAAEIGEIELAELMLQHIIQHSTPYEPIAGQAMLSLIKIYETSGRFDDAAQLKAKFER